MLPDLYSEPPSSSSQSPVFTSVSCSTEFASSGVWHTTATTRNRPHGEKCAPISEQRTTFGRVSIGFPLSRSCLAEDSVNGQIFSVTQQGGSEESE